MPAVGPLETASYLQLIARTHPELRLSTERLPLPSFVTRLELAEPLRPGRARRALVRHGDRLPNLSRPRTLFLGSPFEPYEQTALLDRVASPARLARLARCAARGEGTKLVVLTNVSADHPQLPRWQAAGFLALPSFPDAVLPLGRDPSLAAHLARLPPGDRGSVRRNIRRFERAGFSLEAHRGSSAHLAEALYEAYLPFRDRAVVHWIAHHPAYFAQLAALGEGVSLTLARDPGGELAGFIVNFIGPRRVQCGRIGVSPRWHRRHAVYFRLLYHAIDEALVHGAQAPAGSWLSLEPTAYRLKRHLGAQRRRLVNLALGVQPGWAALAPLLAAPARRLLAHLERPDTLEKWY